MASAPTLFAGDVVLAERRSWTTFSMGEQAPISALAGPFGRRGAAFPDTPAKATAPVSAATMMRMSAFVASPEAVWMTAVDTTSTGQKWYTRTQTSKAQGMVLPNEFPGFAGLGIDN